MRRPTISFVLAVALATAGPSFAQQPVAGTRVEAVQLDVIVTDSSGKPVTGLTKADFLVLEDKKEQKLSTFLFVEGRLPKSAAAAAPPAPGAAAPTPSATAPAATAEGATPGRHLVIVIDDL